MVILLLFIALMFKLEGWPTLLVASLCKVAGLRTLTTWQGGATGAG